MRYMATSEFFGTSLDNFGYRIDRVVFGFGRVAFGNPVTPTKNFSGLSLGKSLQVYNNISVTTGNMYPANTVNPASSLPWGGIYFKHVGFK